MRRTCPFCASTAFRRIRSYREGYSFLYTVLGSIVFGKYGHLWGINQKKHSEWYCPSCGRIVRY